MIKEDGCDSCLYVDEPQGQVLRTEHWNVALAPDQAYLGRTYVTLARHASSLSELTADEWGDFSELVPRLEGATQRAFGAEMMNWGCLMNNAYQVTPALPHVHYHARPRYARPVEFTGMTFEDPEFGHHYDSSRKLLVPFEAYREIADRLAEEI